MSLERRGEEGIRTRHDREKAFGEKNDEQWIFTFGGRGSRLSSAGSLFAAAGLAAAAGFFFAAAGLAVVEGLAVASSSLSADASGLTTVAPAGFFVMVAEFTAFAAGAGAAAAVVVVVVERGSPRRLRRTAFSAYSLIYKHSHSNHTYINFPFSHLIQFKFI